MMKNVLYFLKSWRNLSLMISQLSILMKVVLNLMRTGLTVILIEVQNALDNTTGSLKTKPMR